MRVSQSLRFKFKWFLANSPLKFINNCVFTTHYFKAKYFFWGKYFNFCLFKNPQNSNSTFLNPCFTLAPLPNSLKKDTTLVVNQMTITSVKTLMLIPSLKRTNSSIHSPIHQNSLTSMTKTALPSLINTSPLII